MRNLFSTTVSLLIFSLAQAQVSINPGSSTESTEQQTRIHLNEGGRPMYNVSILNYPDLNAIQKFKKVEFGIDLEGEIEERIKEFLVPGSFPGLVPLNPYIAEDLNPNTSELVVHATFIHPSTRTIKERDFFYYHAYEHAGNDWDDAINDNNDYLMRVRFAPPLPGEWEVHVTVTVDGNTEQLPGIAFVVQDNNHPGYVKVHENNRNLQLGNSIVFPLSHVFPGPYNRSAGGQTPWGDPPNLDPSKNTVVADWNQYLGDIESYIDQGGKSFKMVQTSYGNLIEFEQLGNYTKRMHYAWEQDKIINMCEENDVLINFNLLFQDVIMGLGQNSDGVTGDPWDYGNYGNDYWPTYCYFVPKTLPSNQFLDSVFMNYHKQRTRYYVARYGYSPQIYTWELMSEPFHMDQFHHGQTTLPDGSVISNEPATIFTHPGHTVAIDAINTYHNVLSNYIKNELKDSDHLITLDQSIIDENSSIYPYECAGNPFIDIIGYNYYDGTPDKLIKVKKDKKGKNNLDFNVDENSVYKMFFNKFEQIQKPIILSEAGHGSHVLGLDCFGKSGNIIDAMTLGFTGIAGMHPWEGYIYGENYYDQRLLWPSTIYAEQHMNSDKVIPILNNLDGVWKQGRQIEKVYGANSEFPKELQYYLAQSNELATGYVRNRSHNIYTMRLSQDCQPSSLSEFKSPLDNFYPFSYVDGNIFDNNLYVYGLQKKEMYEIKWYDFITGELILTELQETDRKKRMKLKFPALTLENPLRPILWFSMQKK